MFLTPRLPLPQPARYACGQSMAQLSRQEYELTTMMCFMSDEVVEKVDQVSRKVLPGGWRDRTAMRHAEPDQLNHAFTAAFEGPR